MKKSIVILLFACLCISCSTTKNTAANRLYHEMKVVHNVYFNGMVAYTDGMNAIQKANKDDYSTILNLYPISSPANQQVATSQMEKSIEKSRKCIKLHSIHARPKKINAKKRNDPKYKLWLKSKEFNNQMYRAWLLLGQSEFHKGDFLGSIGTFSYVANLYDTDPDMVAMCQLWIVRAYGELGWQYEAETLLGNIKVDHLKRKHQDFYSAVSADILLKGQHYREAIPFVKIAKRDQKRKEYKPRFEYVLAQLYQKNGQKDAALSSYKRVIRMEPEHVMSFNARLHYYELSADVSKSLKKLAKMARQDKNKEVLDQIYGTMGNIQLANRDTTSALEYYQLAIEKGTRNGLEKAGVMLLAGDLYFSQQQYSLAAPCYKQAVQILPNEDIRYPLADKRNRVLEELVQHTATITLQDSLQYLSTLSEKEQRVIVDSIIARLIRKEMADSIQTIADAREKELDEPLEGVNTDMMIGAPRDNSWYFYNDNLLKKGKQTFARTWGDRPLEDNWRRSSKTSVSSFSPIPTEESDGDRQPVDSVGIGETTSEHVIDTHRPEYYLQQIPHSEEDIQASNQMIADALVGLIFVYQDQLGDYAMAEEVFHEFIRRFPEDSRAVDLYYMQYVTALRQEQDTKADSYKQAILSKFPDSKQAAIVGDPDYWTHLEASLLAQDSLYDITYNAYKKGDYKTVKVNKQFAEKNYPLSTLLPRFHFLNAVGVARTMGQDAFVVELQDMVERYPDHELSTRAKNMLAMMGEGLKSQKGGAMNDLQTAREKQEQTVEETETPRGFVPDRDVASSVLVLLPQDQGQLNTVLYQVALFNFSQFLIKDFDIQTIMSVVPTKNAVQISGFESMDEAEWYVELMKKDADLSAFFATLPVEIMPISSQNQPLLNSLGEEAYLKFYRK